MKIKRFNENNNLKNKVCSFCDKPATKVWFEIISGRRIPTYLCDYHAKEYELENELYDMDDEEKWDEDDYDEIDDDLIESNKYIKKINMIKLFEEFKNSKKGDVIKKKFDKIRLPEKPFKRKLTFEENKLMFKNFKNHSWSNFIDKNGYIILGGGEEYGGIYYITEKDLEKIK